MDIHDLGGLVWAIFVIIAVISSIVRSARRNAQTMRPTPPPEPRAQPAPTPPQSQAIVPPRVAPPAARRVVSPVIPSVASTDVRAKSRDRYVVTAASQSLDSAPAGATLGMTAPPPLPFPMAAPRRRAERLFGPGISVVKGIVALEVLGPPRALREWTPLA